MRISENLSFYSSVFTDIAARKRALCIICRLLALRCIRNLFLKFLVLSTNSLSMNFKVVIVAEYCIGFYRHLFDIKSGLNYLSEALLSG